MGKKKSGNPIIDADIKGMTPQKAMASIRLAATVIEGFYDTFGPKKRGKITGGENLPKLAKIPDKLKELCGTDADFGKNFKAGDIYKQLQSTHRETALGAIVAAYAVLKIIEEKNAHIESEEETLGAAIKKAKRSSKAEVQQTASRHQGRLSLKYEYEAGGKKIPLDEIIRDFESAIKYILQDKSSIDHRPLQTRFQSFTIPGRMHLTPLISDPFFSEVTQFNMIPEGQKSNMSRQTGKMNAITKLSQTMDGIYSGGRQSIKEILYREINLVTDAIRELSAARGR